MPRIKVSKIPYDPLNLHADLHQYIKLKNTNVIKTTLETTRVNLHRFYSNRAYKYDKQVYENALAQLWNSYNEYQEEFILAYPSHNCQAFKEYIKTDRISNNRLISLRRSLSNQRADSLITKNKIIANTRLEKLKIIRSIFLTLNKHVAQYSLHNLHYKVCQFIKVCFLKAKDFINECKENIDLAHTKRLPFDKKDIKYIQSAIKTFESFISIYQKRRDKRMNILTVDANLKYKLPYDMLNYISGFIGN